jgi:7-cyano-7-deazaguanine synthase
LVSGGIDSAVLLHRLLTEGYSVLPLYVRCGLRWETAEVFWLRRLLGSFHQPRLQPLVIADLPLQRLYGDHWSLTGQRVPGARSPDAAVYLPGRNLFLLMAAALVSLERGISTIAIGTLRGNPFGDATARFFRQCSDALTQALSRPVEILAPLQRLKKPQVVRMGARLPLQLTFSCLRPRLPAGRQAAWRHCGRCNKCAERLRALRLFDALQTPRC